MNLRVRHLDGSPIGWKPALLRNVSRFVDGFPYVIPYLVGAITIGATRNGSALAMVQHARFVTYK